MELKYEIGVRRKIFEYIFISNLNQVIRTRDMAVFMGHVQALSEYLIPLDIFILTEPDRCLKLYMDVSFDFQVV